MNKEKLDSFITSEVAFIGEQIGIPENEFKESVLNLFQEKNRVFRAYLSQVKYLKIKECDVALCIATSCGEDEELASAIAVTFRRMFGLHEHLDILFINDEKEFELRKVCCPFYSSKKFFQPDFYLSSSEGYRLETARACYKKRRLMGDHPDGYMLCEVFPSILGQPYGLGGDNIDKIIIASRHSGCSIFKIDEWPRHVHVARMIGKNVDNKFSIERSDIESIGWAQINEQPISY